MTCNALQPVKKFGPQPDTPLLCLEPRGLAIFPTRYAVFPDTPAFAGINLPGGMGDKVTDVALKHHKYGLRLLRKGFVYIYYHDHPNNKKWDIYEVDEDSTLDQLGVKAFKRGEKKVHLANQNCFFIEKPWDIDKVDFAFSEHPWSKETLEQMESDGALRDKRMQTFRPKKWINSPSYPHGKKLTVDNLEKVLEYSGDEQVYKHLHETDVKHQPISDETGKHNSDTLKLCTSANAFRMRTDEAAEDVKRINLTPNSERNHPMMLALWDAVGITRELNGFALDAGGWVDQYQSQSGLKIHAAESIQNIKTMMEVKAVEFFEENNSRLIVGRGEYEDMARVKPHPRGWPEGTYARALASEEDILRYGHRKVEVIFPNHAQRQETRRQKAQKESWRRYAKKFDQGQFDTFNANYQALITEAETLIEERISDQIVWLESVRLTDALAEYHEESPLDGNFFEDLVGDLFTGLGACPSGDKRLKDYVESCTYTDDNLLWRAIAANQTKGRVALTQSLAQLNANQATVANKQNIDKINTSAASLIDELVAVSTTGLSLAHTVKQYNLRHIPTAGIDKIFIAMSERLLKPFLSPLMDTVANVIAESIFLSRAGINQFKANQYANQRFIDDKAALKAEKHSLIYDKFDNPEWKARTKPDKQNLKKKSLDKIENKLSKMLTDEKYKFQLHKTSYTYMINRLAEDEAAYKKKYQRWMKRNAALEVRFGILMGVIQAAAAWQLFQAYCQNPKDKMLLGNLIIASASTTAVIAELASHAVKKNTRFYTTLKVGGAGLMVVGGVMSGMMDFAEGGKSAAKKNSILAFAFYSKGTLNFLSAGFGGMALYAALNAGWEKRMAKGVARYLAPRLAAALAVRFGLMAFFMSIGIGLTMIAFGIELLVLLLKDNDLQNWLEKTPFAKKDSQGDTIETPFETIEEQNRELDYALASIMGLSKPPKPEESTQPSAKHIPNFDDMKLMP